MKVTILTLVDITQTNASRDDDQKKRNQQSNYLVAVQTSGLRVNPIPVSVNSFVENIDKLGFGSNYSDKQRYWEFVFEYEYTNGLTEEMLLEDFELIPVITGLDETTNINNSVFRTTNKQEKNIIFKLSDNDLDDI